MTRIRFSRDLRCAIPLPACTFEVEAKKRSGLLADVACRMRWANADPELALQVVLELGACQAGEPLSRAMRRLNDSAGGVIAAATGAVPETVTFYAERWGGDRKRRGIDSAIDDLSALRRYVLPAIGDLPIAIVAQEDLKAVVRALEEKVAAGQLSPVTGRSIWLTCRRMFKHACDGESPVLQANPCDGVAPPFGVLSRRPKSTAFCNGCGASFQPRVSYQKFCARRCRQVFHNRRRQTGSVGSAMTSCALDRIRREVVEAKR